MLNILEYFVYDPTKPITIIIYILLLLMVIRFGGIFGCLIPLKYSKKKIIIGMGFSAIIYLFSMWLFQGKSFIWSKSISNWLLGK